MARKKEESVETQEDLEKTGDTEEPGGRKGSLKKIILLAVIVIVVLAAGGGAVFFGGGLLDFAVGLPGGEFVVGLLGGEKKSGEEGAAEPQEGDVGEEKGEAVHGEAENGGYAASRPSVDLKPFLVNLADKERRRYLRITLNLALHKEEDKEDFDDVNPRIRNAVLMLLSSKLSRELLTVEGKAWLHEEIVNQLNVTVRKEMVAEVYFVDFIMQ